MQAVEGKERALRERGAAWNPPTLTASLRSLPFLSQVPEGLFEEIVLQVRPRPAPPPRWTLRTRHQTCLEPQPAVRRHTFAGLRPPARINRLQSHGRR